MVTSQFKTGSLFNFFFVFFISTIGSMLFLIKIVKSIFKDETSTAMGALLLAGTIFIVSILFLNTYRYLKIDSIKRELRYYSLLNPHGKLIRFGDFKGMIKSPEITLYGEVETIYFVNKKGNTQFKINTALYKNSAAVKDAIPLKEIKNYDFGFCLYLKLIFTGKIKIVTRNN